MDVHIGDLHSAIVDRELEIVHELSEEIFANLDCIVAAADVCAELDCLLSFAQASRQYDYCRPEIVDENIIDIVQGK